MTRRQRLAAALLAAAFAAFYAATTRGVLAFGDDVLAFQVAEAIVERGEVAVPSPFDRGTVARAIPGDDGRGYSKYGLGTPLAAVPFYLAGRAAERRGFELPETRDGEGNLRTGTRVFAAGLVNALAGALAVLALVALAVEAGFTFPVALALGALLGGATFFAHSAATLLSEPLAAAALTAAAAAALRARSATLSPERSFALRSRAGSRGERRDFSDEGRDESQGQDERQRRSVEGRSEDGGVELCVEGGDREAGEGENERPRPTVEGRDEGEASVRAEVGAGSGRIARAVAASGVLAGFAVLVKVAHLVAVLPLGLWLLWELLRDGDRFRIDPRHRRRAFRLSLLWASFASAFVSGVGVYNFARFGSVFETGYGAEATRLTTAPWVGLAGLLVSPGKGILWYAPPLWLAVVGWRALARRRPEVAGLVAAIVTGPLLLASVYYQWHGGGSWGPRLLLPVLPVALLGAGEMLERARRGVRPAVAATGLVAAAGALVVALAVLVPFDRYHARVWPDPEAPDPERFAAMVWSPPASPLAVHLRALPGALSATAAMLAGRAPLPGPEEKGRAGLPDLAFARYGSHALLEWTRGALLLALACGAAAVVTAAAPRRGQKASLSRPPQ